MILEGLDHLSNASNCLKIDFLVFDLKICEKNGWFHMLASLAQGDYMNFPKYQRMGCLERLGVLWDGGVLSDRF